MRRRHLLRIGGVGAAAMAGCLSDVAGTGDDDATSPAPTATRTPTTDRPTTLPRHTTFPPDTDDDGGGSDGAARLPARVGVATPTTGRLREAFDVAAAVEVVAPGITDGRTARIELTLANEGSTDRTLTYTRRVCDLDLLRGRRRDGAGTPLLLVAADALDRATADCPRPDPRDLSCGIPARDHEVEIGSGETVSRTYRLWVDPTADAGPADCLAPGVYGFEREYRAGGDAATLSFELAVQA